MTSEHANQPVMSPKLAAPLPARRDLFRPANLRRVFWLLAAGWTLLIGVSLRQSWQLLQRGALEIAVDEARDDLAEDLAYRSWATRHGGVYVPVTPETPPSPYLAGLPERDLTTPSGRQLTLLNPEYMARQIFEAAAGPSGLRQHITSLKPLRPQNAPDEWEAAALRAFETGQKEVASVGDIAGQPYYRLMRPLVTEAGCLKCHGAQGYRVGDVRGGISTSVPLAPHRAVARAQFLPIAGGHAALWVLGLGTLAAGYRQTRRSLAERERASAALRASEDRYRSLVEESPDTVGIYQEGKLVFVNSTGARQLGAKTQDELLGRTSEQLIHPDDLEVARDRIRRRLAGETGMYPVEVRYLRLDGTTLPVEVSATPITFNGAPAVQFIARDITARQRMQEALRESRQTLRQILDSIPVRVFWKDRNLTYLGCNQPFALDAGLQSPEEIIGKSDLEMGWKAQAELYRADDRQVMESGQPKASYEEPQTKPDGSGIWLRTNKVPLRDAEGRIKGVLGTYEDITERKRMEKVQACLAQLAYKLSLLNNGRQAARLVADAAQDLLAWDACFLRLRSPDLARVQDIFDMDTVDGRRVEMPSTSQPGPPGPMEERVIREGAQIVLRTGEADAAEGLVPFGNTSRRSASLLFVPLRHHGQHLGLFSIQSYRVGAYDRAALDLLQTLADHAAGALERIRAEQEREKLIGELKAVLAEVKTLSGLIPICAGCKKIRDDQNYWHQVDSYIAKHTDATFTHGMCPDCVKKWYPDLAEDGPPTQ